MPSQKMLDHLKRARSARKTHRMKGSPTHFSWTAMLSRCRNPNRSNFKNYGGRGISVCQRWLIFENFLADMGLRPEGTEIDRDDVNGNYEPGNCRWATLDVQANNKRDSKKFEYNGECLTLPQWARKLGVSFPKLRARIRLGWSIAETLSTK